MNGSAVLNDLAILVHPADYTKRDHFFFLQLCNQSQHTPKIIYLHLKDQKNRDLGAEPELPVYFPRSCLGGFPQGLDCFNSKYRCLSFN